MHPVRLCPEHPNNSQLAASTTASRTTFREATSTSVSLRRWHVSQLNTATTTLFWCFLSGKHHSLSNLPIWGNVYQIAECPTHPCRTSSFDLCCFARRLVCTLQRGRDHTRDSAPETFRLRGFVQPVRRNRLRGRRCQQYRRRPEQVLRY